MQPLRNLGAARAVGGLLSFSSVGGLRIPQNPRTINVGKEPRDHQVHPVPDPHLAAQPRALSTMSRDGDFFCFVLQLPKHWGDLSEENFTTECFIWSTVLAGLKS